MSPQIEDVASVDITLVAGTDGGVRVAWRYGAQGFEKFLSASRLVAFMRQAAAIRMKIKQDLPIYGELLSLGKELGEICLGHENASSLLDFADLQGGRFIVCRVGGPALAALALPWETLCLPDSDQPLLFHPRLKGAFDFVRIHEPGPELAGRRVRNKCLAFWSIPDLVPPEQRLMVRQEVDELRQRLLQHQSMRFRWILNPDFDELAARLRLECSLLVYAGHGRLHGTDYEIQLKSGRIAADSLLDGIRGSRSEVLIFNSCDSGLLSDSAGLPLLLRQLPQATCLLGMQGATSDIVSCWQMPALVERLLIGQPIWACVNLWRNLLYFEQRSDAWLLPVIHLKPAYQPFQPAQWTTSYLDELARVVAER